MADIDITQQEADELLACKKIRASDTEWEYPLHGGSIVIPLLSEDRRESFLLDIHRARLDLQKGTYQNRARQVVALLRLDFGGKPHRNPDGQEIGSPHLHVYREGYGDKWAMPVPTDTFSDMNDLQRVLDDFMRYCNIVDPPIIRPGLFP